MQGIRAAVVVLGMVWGVVAHAGEWEFLDEEDGVRSYGRDVEGSPLKSFRGVGTISAPLGKILWVLTDTQHRSEWVDRLYISSELEFLAKHDFVIYQAYELPAWFDNRDYVFRARAFREDDDSVTVELSSVRHAKAPKTVGIRAHLHYSRYVLRPVGPSETLVEVEIQTDPRGLLPSWLVNYIQKSWPIATLRGLAEQVKKPYVQSYLLPPFRNPQIAAPTPPAVPAQAE